MWFNVSKIILRNKYLIITAFLLLGIFLALQIKKVQISYEIPILLPKTDSIYKQYVEFKKIFGEDGNVIVFSVVDSNFFTYDKLKDYIALNKKIKQINEVEEVISIVRFLFLKKDTINKTFKIEKILDSLRNDYKFIDSLKDFISKQKIYENIIFFKEKPIYNSLIVIKGEALDNKDKIYVSKEIFKLVKEFSEKYNLEYHISGLPYLRAQITEIIEKEAYLFLILSLILAFLIMYVYFRSFTVIFVSLLIVLYSVLIFSGIMVLFNYKITILTALLPSLLIIIGIENSIFFIRRFIIKYKATVNKIKAISLILDDIAVPVFLTNLTTAIGFGSFVFTSNSLFKEFGKVAFICILAEFFISLIFIPILLTFFKTLKPSQFNNTSEKASLKIISVIESLLAKHHNKILIITSFLILISFVGIFNIKLSGKVIDDLKKSSYLYKDLKFFEENFGGIIPLQIVIDTKKRKGIQNHGFFTKVSEFQEFIRDSMGEFFSCPISIIELFKYLKFSYYNYDTSKYNLPSKNEFLFISDYLKNVYDKNKSNLITSYIDTNYSITKISYQIKDVGYLKIIEIEKTLNKKLKNIFKDKYNYYITGVSIVFSKGVDFLLKNLFQSIILALVLISLLLLVLFSSKKIIFVSILSNLIPLLFVAGIMGFFSVPLKASTIILFSITFGISVDNSIHFLARFRKEYAKTKDKNLAITNSLRSTGSSMIFASSILILGFLVFVFSVYGGTAILGFLISLSLLNSLCINLILLPTLILKLKIM